MNFSLLFSMIVACLLTSASARAESRPNFLLIVADDATWSDFGFTGSRNVRTPHLDRLAREGMQLTGMFSPATTCSPSRHALYTGLYPIRSGAFPNHTRVYEGTRSVFTLLRNAGYRVALQGKQHVGPSASFPYELIGNGARGDDFAATREFTARNADEPWLLVFASNDPHSPWNRGEAHVPAAEIQVPAYLHDNAVTRNLLAAYYAEINKLDWQVGELLSMLEANRQADNTLVVFVSEQGSSFPYGGKWSVYDNGIRAAALARWPGSIAPGSTCDALMQYVDLVPTFLDAAGIDPQSIDVGCPDASGVTGFDGRSFLSVLTGQDQTHRSYVFAQHTTVGINGFKDPYPMRAVRDERYKLIRNLAPQNTYSITGIHEDEPFRSWQADAEADTALARRVEWLFHRPAEELYDLETDDSETHNLADDPALAEIKQRLASELDGWMKQQGDRGLETELLAPSRQPRRKR